MKQEEKINNRLKQLSNRWLTASGVPSGDSSFDSGYEQACNSHIEDLDSLIKEIQEW